MKIIKVQFLLFLVLFFICGVFGSEDKKEFDAHATGIKYFFECNDMDFHFGNLILGAVINGGAAIGEVYFVASNIKDGSADDWKREWKEMAERVEARGMDSFKKGNMISARNQFLRAAYYYRISLISMLPSDSDLKFRADKCRQLMKKAGELLEPKLEYFEISHNGFIIPGFFRKAKNDNIPVKTLIMVGGGETFAEDLFFYIGPQAYEHGYNFVTLDLPGQGIMPLFDKIFTSETYLSLKPVIDYLLTRDDVDSEKIYAYGISGGGVFVPQAAAVDKRIKAIAMNSGVYNAYELFATMPVTKATKEDMDSWTNFHRDVVRSINWRWGVDLDNPAGLIEANKGFEFDPKKISVPTLLIIGEGEYRSKEVQRQQKMIIDNIQHDHKKMVITPSNEGATNHCVMENRSLIAQVLFDFFDEIAKDE